MAGFFTFFSRSLLLFPVAVSLYGCPYSSSYKLEKEGSIAVDNSFTGKWATMVETRRGQQPVKIIITPKTETEYNIYFTGAVEDLRPYRMMTDDTLKATAFISQIAKWQFLNLEINGQTYISEIQLKENRLSILPLAEYFTAKYIKNGDELRTAVEFHFKTRVTPSYDETFSLKDMVRVN